MESYIQISKLNDFIFCPMSLYFHSFYDNYDQKIYHEKPQTVGKIAHENIDNGKYSTAKKYLQALPIYSSRFNLMGKIDIYDAERKYLIERKYNVKKIYDGYVLQLYAQFFCLEEMGFPVEKMFIHSLSDNKRYEVKKPGGREEFEFERIIEKIKCFDLLNFNKDANPNKCNNCIYRELCNR
ncbi:MAG: type V CRISPR-associated protein Cas4 [Candidatus Moranbacteria bacterium]|jgi:CRISPR-associated protein Cas4|nr:type V CRISPR-associated protein Cas4 [Candidatus Moranbacteria bacterium]